jgi:hypothetical protein
MFRARIRGRAMWSGDGDLHWVYLGNMKVLVEIGGGKKNTQAAAIFPLLSRNKNLKLRK